MPFDFDRIIDHQLYLATQQCIHPYVQQRRVSSAPISAAAAAGPARAAGGRKSSLGSLVSPWSPFSSGGGGSSSSSSSSSSNNGNPRSSAAYSYQPSRPQGSSPVDLFFTAPVGFPVRGRARPYGRGTGIYAQPAGDESSSSLDQFVTAPVGDFTIGAGSNAAGLLPSLQPRHCNGSRPGSSDSDNWTFATASGGSVTGTCSGLDTTVDLTPSPPPSSLQAGKIARYKSAAAAQPLEQEQNRTTGPASARVPALKGATAVTLPVQDLQRTKRFYEHVFGAPCLSSSEDGKSASLRLNDGALVVTLHESPDKRRRDGAGQGVLLSVPVDDISEVCRRLRSFAGGDEGEDGEDVAGQEFAGPVAGPGGSRVITFLDPAGYRWQVGQEFESS